jgi:hypothetical protein
VRRALRRRVERAPHDPATWLSLPRCLPFRDADSAGRWLLTAVRLRFGDKNRGQSHSNLGQLDPRQSRGAQSDSSSPFCPCASPPLAGLLDALQLPLPSKAEARLTKLFH